MIKDSSLIVSQEVSEAWKVFKIKRTHPTITDRDVKLGDVFSFIPHGLVLKEETGLGATTLELQAERNSIIVEPIKITASSKAIAHKAQYVGSPNLLQRQQIKPSHIKAYLADASIKPKKFVVVADSLPRLINTIGEVAYSDYFLMIDEVDSFQLDSSYRVSMESCIDIYKKFPEDKRAMVSATVMDFSDPDIQNETKTIFKYDMPVSRRIDLSYCPKNILSAAASKVVMLCAKHPSEKIMIAFNSVSGCLRLADYLNKNSIIETKNIKILCSSNSKEKVGKYYAELESTTLPSSINFVTSAYFSGFDLLDRYHLISISNNISIIHSLSDKRLKQIAGRCRDPKGLLSETILYNTISVETSQFVETIEELKEVARHEISALACLERNFSKHPLLKASTEAIRNMIAQQTRVNGLQLVRIKDKKPYLSYLSLDAYIEHQRVRKQLYQSKSDLPGILIQAGHSIKSVKLNETIVLEKAIQDIAGKEKEVQEILDKLRKCSKDYAPILLLKRKGVEFSSIQKDIIYKWQQLYKNIGMERFFALVEKAAINRDKRQLNNVFGSAYYACLSPESHYKRQVSFHIPLGQSFTNEELLSKWNTIFMEAGYNSTLKTEIQAVRYTRIHYKIIKRKGVQAKHFISRDNPLNLDVISTKLVDSTPIPIDIK